MSETANKPTAPMLDDASLDAYYFGFTRTGIAPVDAVLSSVAIAGAVERNTQNWQDEVADGALRARPGLPSADTPEQLIQRTAEVTARYIERTDRALTAVMAWIETTETEAPSSVVARVGKLRSILNASLNSAPAAEMED